MLFVKEIISNIILEYYLNTILNLFIFIIIFYFTYILNIIFFTIFLKKHNPNRAMFGEYFKNFVEITFSPNKLDLGVLCFYSILIFVLMDKFGFYLDLHGQKCNLIFS